MKEHVVVIYPHPDDESFGAAGTIAQFREKGVPVTYLCGTLGEMGRNMGSPAFANRETLPKIRKKELIDACKVLDMDLQMLGYRDKTLEFEDRTKVAKHLLSILETIKPSHVITHYPEYAVHPDHDAFGAAAVEAVGMMDAGERPEVWAQAITNNYTEVLGKPDISNDVTALFDTKMKAIEAHQSQAAGMFESFRRAHGEENTYKAAKKQLGVEQFYRWSY